eukprot:TRINITY_DN56470_c0_g1_i1.p1 TRINITY_DN56470_c0_g1~~TRINITY_DN56470_c0_g1_i1.p1  ORF type:complete len:511 (+),score=74.54 TRINITY_DN56470_c0_g1_i1:130-1662(+)
MSKVRDFVHFENDDDLGFRCLKTTRFFKRGDAVFKEAPIAESSLDADFERMVAYLQLAPAQKSEFINVFTGAELQQRRFGVESVSESRKEEYEVLLERAQDEGCAPTATLSELVSAMCRWAVAVSVSRVRMYKHISRLTHSCAASVELEHDAGLGIGVVRARFALWTHTRIGIWLLEDVHLWWKGADVRSKAIQHHGLWHQDCVCERCMGADFCRALRCPTCDASGNSGEVVRDGQSMKWTCVVCKFTGSDDCLRGVVTVEQQLIKDLSHVHDMAITDVDNWVCTVVQRLGPQHWLFAAVQMEMYQRQLRRTDNLEMDFRALAASLQFLEWLSSRKIVGVPPTVLLEELGDMALRALGFLARELGGVRDLRVIFLRAVPLIRTLFERMDKKLFPELQPYSDQAAAIRESCAFCGTKIQHGCQSHDISTEVALLPEASAAIAFGSGEESSDGENIVYREEETGPTTCGLCEDLLYCDLSCQKADIIRHKSFCVPKGKTFFSKAARQVMILS